MDPPRPLDGRDDRLGNLPRAARIELCRRGMDDQPRQDVVVGAMCRGQFVQRRHGESHPCRHGLLADAGVERAVDQACVVEQPALEAPDRLDEEESHRQLRQRDGGQLDLPRINATDVRVVQGGSPPSRQLDRWYVGDGHRSLASRSDLSGCGAPRGRPRLSAYRRARRLPLEKRSPLWPALVVLW
jgi:hypothetical protein